MRVVGLFSGIGVFEVAFVLAGAQLVAVAETDRDAQFVLAHHFPDVPNLGDVRTAVLPECDVVTGGFPCQDISKAGAWHSGRPGLDGERSGLWWDFARIAADHRPRWLVVENVPALLTSNGGRDMGALLWGLAELGYGCAWRVVDGQHFGVPQARRRLFVVGHLGDPAPAGRVLLDPEGPHGPWPSLADPPSEREEGPHPGVAVARAWPDPAGSMSRRAWKGMNSTFTDGALILDEHGLRRPTVTEAERMFGLPDGWTAVDDGRGAGVMADYRRLQLLGNAVVLPVAEWIAHRLVYVESI